jgi:uncharacterized protein YndB with AHSA1/START domain
MTVAGVSDYGELIEPATLRIRRLLPGPIERVWAYLTDSELRKQWLAAGDMDLHAGALFELVWRNGELADVPSMRPDGVSEESRMKSRIIEVKAPTTLVFAWGDSGEVRIDLEAKGADVLLTLVHRRLAHDQLLIVSAGWHMHLDILNARASGAAPLPFWEGWRRLQSDYATRFQSH